MFMHNVLAVKIQSRCPYNNRLPQTHIFEIPAFSWSWQALIVTVVCFQVDH